MTQVAIATTVAATALAPVVQTSSTDPVVANWNPITYQAIPRSSSQFGDDALLNTIYGPTGLIVIPTADVAPTGSVNFGANFAEDLSAPSGNWGITDSVEVGGAYVDRDGSSDKFLANAKVRLVPANFDWLTVGVGIIDAFDAVGETIYVVATANLVVPDQIDEQFFGLRAHLGAGTGMFNEEAFGGAELRFDDRISILGEWDTRDVNFAVRYSHSEDFGIQVGNQGDGFYLGSTYRLRF